MLSRHIHPSTTNNKDINDIITGDNVSNLEYGCPLLVQTHAARDWKRQYAECLGYCGLPNGRWNHRLWSTYQLKMHLPRVDLWPHYRTSPWWVCYAWLGVHGWYTTISLRQVETIVIRACFKRFKRMSITLRLAVVPGDLNSQPSMTIWR